MSSGSGFINGEVGVGVGAIDDDIDVHVKGKQEQGQKDILWEDVPHGQIYPRSETERARREAQTGTSQPQLTQQ